MELAEYLHKLLSALKKASRIHMYSVGAEPKFKTFTRKTFIRIIC